MAKKLISASIATGLTIEAAHVTQSADAFTGKEAYDITISGSLTTTGSILNNGNITTDGSVTVGTGAYVITDNIRAHPGDTINLVDSINVSGNITSSGNISASGNLFANDIDATGEYYIQGNHTLVFSGGNRLMFGTALAYDILQIGNAINPPNSVELHGPVTAFSSISASGALYGSKLLIVTGKH